MVTLSERDDYDAFGTRLQTAAAKTPWLFGGDGLYDPATGWTYHLARWRDGFRFMSYDKFEVPTQDPISIHKYNYLSHSPVNSWDLSGNFGLTDSLAATSLATTLSGIHLATFSAAYHTVSGLASGNNADQIFTSFAIEQILAGALQLGFMGAGKVLEGLANAQDRSYGFRAEDAH